MRPEPTTIVAYGHDLGDETETIVEVTLHPDGTMDARAVTLHRTERV